MKANQIPERISNQEANWTELNWSELTLLQVRHMEGHNEVVLGVGFFEPLCENVRLGGVVADANQDITAEPDLMEYRTAEPNCTTYEYPLSTTYES